MKSAFFILVSLLGTHLAMAQVERANLFRPVPKAGMREMSTDRPDVTESAYSVNAGHFQYETDLVNWSSNRTESIREDQLIINKATFKVGMFRNSDLQMVVESVVVQTHKDRLAQSTVKKTGFGNVVLRWKQNLFGNDSGKAALAVMPFVTLPTHSLEKGRLEGGIVVPFNLALAERWSMGTQVQAEFKNEFDPGRTVELLQSVTFAYQVTPQMDVFTETYYTHNFLARTNENFLNGGVVLNLAKNINVDAGLNYGIQKGTDKIYFLGLSFRY